MKDKGILYGPFSQVVTMDGMRARGPLKEEDLEIIRHAGIAVENGSIVAVGKFEALKSRYSQAIDLHLVPQMGGVVVPGLMDVHTHICWAGSRSADYASRLSGKTYSEIAREGGGIWSTVLETRKASLEELAGLMALRAEQMTRQGVTTLEVKSGYGLDADNEIKMLESIRMADGQTAADLVPTCLAAHTRPRDFKGSSLQYLERMAVELLPKVREQSLSRRVDIYVDDNAFSAKEAAYYLSHAKRLGFDILVHADQFSKGGANLAVEMKALSADHLEVSDEDVLDRLAASDVVPVLLPGASMGLGTGFAPARRLLDSGAKLAIASDWNPGSAPMGHLLLQAAVLAVYEKLTMAETLAAVTCRAAQALGLGDRGILRPGMKADFVEFPCEDYREILYRQGNLLPCHVWKNGSRVF